MMGDLARYSKNNKKAAKESDETRATNSVIENYFGIIKQDIPKKKRMRPGEFVRKQYVNIKGKLSEIETVIPESTKKVNKKTSEADQEQWKPKKGKSKKKSYYFTPPVKFPEPKQTSSKRKLDFDVSPIRKTGIELTRKKNSPKRRLDFQESPIKKTNSKVVNKLSRKKTYKVTQNLKDDEEFVRSDGPSVKSLFRRSFKNPDLFTCWLNACLQLVLNGMDHHPSLPNFTSSLGKELVNLIRSSENLDPTVIKDIIVSEEKYRKRMNPNAHFLDLGSGQQCVHDFIVAIQENELAWPDVYDLFKFRLTEATMCGNKKCQKLSSSTSRPRIYLEVNVPPKGTALSEFIEEELNCSNEVPDYHCEAVDGGCGERTNAEHTTNIHSTLENNLIIVLLRRVTARYSYDDLVINRDMINATGNIKIMDASGKQAEYRPIAIIEHRGGFTADGKNTRGHYICDIQTRQGDWYRTNDNFKPIHIHEEEVTKLGAVVLYYKISKSG